MSATITFLGVDVSKQTLDVWAPTGAFRVPNTPAGIRCLWRRIQKLPDPIHVVCEPTGGYERDLVAALHEHRVLLSVVNPRQVRDFARAQGRLAKTDALDAKALADYGAACRPRPTPPPSPQHLRLAELVCRQQQLQALLVAEQNRFEHLCDPVLQRMARTFLRQIRLHIARLTRLIQELVGQQPDLDRRVQTLCRVQGVGATTAVRVLTHLPELGSLARKQVAARHNPVLRTVYARLRANGKPPKVALTALMRKLVTRFNTLLNDPDYALAI